MSPKIKNVLFVRMNTHQIYYSNQEANDGVHLNHTGNNSPLKIESITAVTNRIINH